MSFSSHWIEPFLKKWSSKSLSCDSEEEHRVLTTSRLSPVCLLNIKTNLQSDIWLFLWTILQCIDVFVNRCLLIINNITFVLSWWTLNWFKDLPCILISMLSQITQESIIVNHSKVKGSCMIKEGWINVTCLLLLFLKCVTIDDIQFGEKNGQTC